MTKTQFWFNDQQVELIILCLKFTKARVIERNHLSDTQKMTGQFFTRRIDEILNLFDKKSMEMEP